MTAGYLLDVNGISRWFSGDDAVVSNVQRVEREGGLLYVSAISLGELEFGHSVFLENRDLARRDEFARWIDQTFPKGSVVNVDRHTRFEYGQIRAELFRLYPPINPNENHPEKCYDKVAGVELGIDENDLWIAAQAIERGLILVSNDKMERIKEASGGRLRYEDWQKPPI